VTITRGAVKVRDASGVWHPAISVSGVEGTHRDGRKIHDFPVVWIIWPRDSSERRWPWPAEAVEQAEAGWWNSRVNARAPVSGPEPATGAPNAAGVDAGSGEATHGTS
jgi:hypothetical protein